MKIFIVVRRKDCWDNTTKLNTKLVEILQRNKARLFCVEFSTEKKKKIHLKLSYLIKFTEWFNQVYEVYSPKELKKNFKKVH